MEIRKQYLRSRPVPLKQEVISLTKQLCQKLFPLSDEATEAFEPLNHDTEVMLSFLSLLTLGDREKAQQFMEQLEPIRDQLLQDAQFMYEGDPAATSVEEVILSYPGFQAITVYRLAHCLVQLDLPMVPRMMTEWIHCKTGIDIHPSAKIGCPFFIDHGTGVVIGGTAVIGKWVRLYQGVTLGALVVKKSDKNSKRHPTVGNNVVIYANSTILGGDTEIGHDSVIGGNSWLTSSVLPFSVVYTKHETIIREHTGPDKPVDFQI